MERHVWPMLTTFVLLLSYVNVVKAACANPSPNIFEAIRTDGNGAHQTKGQHEQTQQTLLGLMNSACNQDQYRYLVLEAAYNDGLLLDSMCYEEFYVTATNLADVNAWLTCESMALPVALGAFYLQNNYGHSDQLSQKCDFCGDAPFPPVSLPPEITSPQHVWGIQTIVTALDWKNKLLNVQGLGLKKGLISILLSVITDKVKSGALLGVRNLIQADITKGYNPPASIYGTRKRATNATDEAFQYMNSTIEITATFNIVALEPNYTYAQVQKDLDALFKSSNFTSMLAKLNANVTSQTFTTYVPAATASASSSVGGSSGASGSATATGTSASATATQKGSASSSINDGLGILKLMSVILMTVFLL